MPPKTTPICIDCKKTESLLWRTIEQSQICQACFELREAKETDVTKSLEANEDKKTNKTNKDKDSKDETKQDKKDTPLTLAEERGSRLRKSTRATRFKAKVLLTHNSSTSNGNGEKPAGGGNSKQQTKGRNRRSLFKRVPIKTPLAQATTHTVESVFYKVGGTGGGFNWLSK